MVVIIMMIVILLYVQFDSVHGRSNVQVERVKVKGDNRRILSATLQLPVGGSNYTVREINSAGPSYAV